MRSSGKGPSRALFKEIKLRGKHTHSKHFGCSLLPTNRPHISVVVSKSAVNRAHDRNRLRRRVYHQARRLLTEKDEKLSVILFTRRGADSVTAEEISRELTKCFGKG